MRLTTPSSMVESNCPPHPQADDLEHAYALCVRIRRRWAPHDPLAAAIEGVPWGPAASALYAFARQANQIVDDPKHRGNRREALDAWEHQLERAYHGEAWHPVFVALAHAVRTHDIPITVLRDLLISFRHDLAGTQPATFDGLLRHCRMAAGSVGRLVMHLAHETDPRLIARADDLAVGLRLTSIVWDLGRDWRAGRLYLPVEDLTCFGVDPSRWATEGDPATAELIAFQVARARAWLARGRPVVRGASCGVQPLLSVLCHQAQQRLDRVERGDHDPFAR